MIAAIAAPALRRDEYVMLGACEAEIESGLEGFFKVGQALAQIRDSKLYRGRHATWAEYLVERWQMSDRRARQYIAASEVVAEIGTMVPALLEARNHAGFTLVLPSNERQVRPLIPLSPEVRREVWRECVVSAPRGPDGQPRITARHVSGILENRRRAVSPDAHRSDVPNASSEFGASTKDEVASASILDAISAVATALRLAPERVEESAVAALRTIQCQRAKKAPSPLIEGIEILLRALAGGQK